jgi:serine/threonine-protein kinase
MAEVCGGLQVAHELRLADGQDACVVHRDVSPHNILVSTRGSAKLIDFGLAKVRDRMADETSVGIVKGKVRYMAPEQVVGPAVDCRADVWAVGATLYHMLSGAPPYEAATDVDVVRTLMSGTPPRPLGPEVHPAVSAIVMRSLAWRADERFPTARELQRALEQAMHRAGLATTASEVASCLGAHLGDRAQERQQIVALGMRQAVERERIAGRSIPPAHERISGRISTPTPAPSATGSGSTISSGSIAPPPARRAGTVVFATILTVAVLALATLGAVRQLRPSTDLPTAAAAPGVPPAAASASNATVAAARATSPTPAQGQAKATSPGRDGQPAAGSPGTMTVSVSDLPVAPAPKARPRVVGLQTKRTRAAMPGAPAGTDAGADTAADTPAHTAAEDATADETDDDGIQVTGKATQAAAKAAEAPSNGADATVKSTEATGD